MTIKPDKFDAIYALVGGGISENTEGIKYHDRPEDWEPPTEVEIDAKLAELLAEWDAQEYSRERASAYPSTGDQLDMMYKDNLNSTTTHKDAVEAVKTKWPKDNSGPVE